VNVNNAQASVAQWTDLHELSLIDAKQELVDSAVRLSWDDRVESLYACRAGSWHANRLSRSGPAGAVSSWMRAFPPPAGLRKFWGLAPGRRVPGSYQKPASVRIETAATGAATNRGGADGASARGAGTSKKWRNFILRALKAAGLFRR